MPVRRSNPRTRRRSRMAPAVATASETPAMNVAIPTPRYASVAKLLTNVANNRSAASARVPGTTKPRSNSCEVSSHVRARSTAATEPSVWASTAATARPAAEVIEDGAIVRLSGSFAKSSPSKSTNGVPGTSVKPISCASRALSTAESSVKKSTLTAVTPSICSSSAKSDASVLSRATFATTGSGGQQSGGVDDCLALSRGRRGASEKRHHEHCDHHAADRSERGDRRPQNAVAGAAAESRRCRAL